jgi:hypothetical protein
VASLSLSARKATCAPGAVAGRARAASGSRAATRSRSLVARKASSWSTASWSRAPDQDQELASIDKQQQNVEQLRAWRRRALKIADTDRPT